MAAAEGSVPLTPNRIRAFEALYDAHFDTVYGYAATRLGHTEAEDVSGEVFQAAVVAYRDGHSEQVTIAWLMGVTRHKVIDRWRKASTRKAKAHLLRSTDVTEFPDRWAESSRRDQVVAALDELASHERALLILRHVDGMPVTEMADAVGKSVQAMESALARARRKFRGHYERLEGNHNA